MISALSIRPTPPEPEPRKKAAKKVPGRQLTDARQLRGVLAGFLGCCSLAVAL